MPTDDRRPSRARQAAWAQAAAAALADGDANPTLIVSAGVAFALFGAAMMLWAGAEENKLVRIAPLVVAMAAVAARETCDLLGDMVATDRGRGGPAWPIWRELTERISDAVLLAGAGYGAATIVAGEEMGWIAAALGLMAALVRLLGHSLGFPEDFSGLAPSPRRMAALAAALAISLVEPLWGWRGQSLMIALALIALATAFTVANRIRRLAGRLAARALESPPPKEPMS
ncbi:MAG TPA: CDP-alcohol phosphatidyltransferase family protein [Caulobacteraceae bacterium]|jgi:hypothetical protein